MEYTNAPRGPQSAPSHQPARAAKRGVSREWPGMRYMFFALLLGIALLLSAVSLFTALGSGGGESKLINSKEYQAVFLNNGQVYFGKIKALNDKYVSLQDIFYIEAQNSQAQATSNNNYTLRKLGTSELHAPEDRMVVNRDQVTFWENIKDSSRVVQAINQYKQNPNAANQVQSNGSTGQQSTTPTANQNTTNNSTGTTGR